MPQERGTLASSDRSATQYRTNRQIYIHYWRNGMKCGFIGLGDQGGAMATMMLRAGLPLTVWTRRPEAAAPFVSEGAKVAKNPSALAAQCDLLSLCVTDGDAVRQIVHDMGVLRALRPGAVLAIHSTVLPSLSEEIAAEALPLGVEVLDAPVSGSSRAALNGTLLVMVGGSTTALDKARPAFETYADPILHVGKPGTAMRAKLINNLVWAANLGAAVRSLNAAGDAGLDHDGVRRVLLSGTGRSAALEFTNALTSSRAHHAAPLVLKDMVLAREALASEELLPLFDLADGAISWMEGLTD
ncbi:NAD(P)-dependent oxidoreductase [Caballeronia sp. LZ001]|nr:NAD(P)-dependent oxidoreductase [Caballeronia sp. LZ001]